MKNKKKICIVITTRGNYAKMKSVIDAVNGYDNLELQLVAGGGVVLPRYGLTIDALGKRQNHFDRYLHFMVEGENPVAMAKSAGLAVIDFTTAFENLCPDLVIVIADRFECLSIAMAACYMNTPIAHIEGGEVSGSVDEIVRHAITKLSQIHFPANEDAARRIEKMGERPELIFPVGNTCLDVLNHMDLSNLDDLMDIQEKVGVGPVIDLRQPYLVVLQHPVTTEYEHNYSHINETASAIEELKMNTIWIWPNMDAGSDWTSKGIRIYREQKNPRHVHFFKSLSIDYYGPLLANAACIAGNSSSGIRESAFLGVPSVNIGTRQNGRLQGENTIDVPNDKARIVRAVKRQLEKGRYKPSPIYGNGNAGQKIAEILSRLEVDCQKTITY